MKSSSLKTSISGTLFVMLIILTFTVVRPAYNRLTKLIAVRVESYRTELEQKTGLTFSYTSFSPSILSALRIKGIVVSDAENGKEIISIKNVVLTYKFSDLIRGNIDSALKSLTVNGLTLEWQNATEETVRRKVTSFLTMLQKNSVRNSEAFKFSLPLDIYFRNSAVHYVDNTIDITTKIKKFFLQQNKNGGNYEMNFSGSASANFEKKGLSFSGNCTASGTVFSSLNGSSVKFDFDNVTDGNVTLAQLVFVVSYDNEKFHFETLHAVLPLYVRGDVETGTGNVDFFINTDRYDPLALVSFKKMPDIVRKLRGTSITMQSKGSLNFKSGKFAYASKGILYEPEKIIPGGLRADFSLSTDKKSLSVSSLKFIGRDCEGSFSGTYRYKNMQLSGLASIKKIQLPGGIVSADLYFDPLESGFMCFSPQVIVGDSKLTAVQLSVIPQKDSFDFSLESYDYSHPEADKPGTLNVDGSYLVKTGYFQTGVSADSLYLDSAVKLATVCMSSDKAQSAQNMADKLHNFIYSGELYFSTDLKTYSFNVPYSIIANTNKDKQMLIFAVDGNNSNINISRLDFVYDRITAKMTIQAEIDPDMKEAFFTSSSVINSIPYNFNGTVSREWINIMGDYGFTLSAAFSPLSSAGPEMSGSLTMTDFPVSVSPYIFTFSADTSFSYSTPDGFQLDLTRFEAQEPSGKIAFAPKVDIVGTINKYGFIASSLSYTDKVSVLEGDGSILWNINNGIFDSVNVHMGVKNPLSDESIDISGNVTNPGHMPVSIDALKNDFYFSFQASAKAFPFARLLQNQHSDDSLSASATMNGTFESPYITVFIDSGSATLVDHPLVFGGTVVLEDNTISVSEAHVSWNGLDFSSVKAQYAVSKGDGSCSADFKAHIPGLDREITAPIEIKMSDAAFNEKSRNPQAFSMTVTSDSVGGSMFTTPFAVMMRIQRSPGRLDIYSGQNIGLYGYILDNGAVSLNLTGDMPLHMAVNGSVSGDAIDLRVTDLSAGLPELTTGLNLTTVKIYRGILQGACTITGNKYNPDITGSFFVSSPEYTIPGMFPDMLVSDNIVFTVGDNQLNLPETEIREGKKSMYASGNVGFEGSSISTAQFNLYTKGENRIPVRIVLPFLKLDGPLNVKLSIDYANGEASLKSVLDMQRTTFSLDSRHFDDAIAFLNAVGIVPMNIDLSLVAHEHVQFLLDPLLRCVVVPQSVFKVGYSTAEQKYTFGGNIGFRGGDITYLNRSFYLKDGGMTFSPNVQEPRISLTAETRERDDNGQQVTITLKAENQLFSQFNPTLTASPAKSEAEIMDLLGQIVTGDSSNVGSFLFAVGDYYTQVTVMRKIENTLRDLLNFDIFSVRTQILQNALKLGLNFNSGSRTVTASNFLDNSTVYIGKYFGSSLYVDALMQWSYDETKKTANGLVFQPEFGLEMSAPFATIRWDIAPDIDALQNNLWIPATSITLSWKFTF